MNTQDFKRKLTAVFSADVAEYSRLMGDDERATVDTITSYRSIMTELIQAHHGRVVDAKGDNVLAEFPSVVDAIQCAVEVQKELDLKNVELPEKRRMAFRIGVNLGDVIEKGDTIYGDGVNIAARMESLAEGGGICISGTAFDQVGKKLPLGYKYLGEQKVKNIEKPIRAYKVLIEPEAAGKVIGERQRLKMWHWTAIFALVVLIAVGGGLALWEFYVRPDVAPASIEKMAHPLPDKPSIAVLPFDNMSKDPEQEYFCDGLSEDIISALSSIPDLFVIARNSTFTYKGKPVKVQQVSEELGVQYVLEGSVRKSEDRIRVTAQLIDALSGKHVWAEKYDRELKDVFAVTDEITLKIVEQLQVKMTKREGMMPCWRGTNNIQAYLKYLQGWWYYMKHTVESNAMARQLSQEAIALDPEYSVAYTLLAYTHYTDVIIGSAKSPKESIAKALELAQKALSANPVCPAPHQTLSSCYLLMRRHDEAIAASEQTISLDPNYSNAYAILATNLFYAGRAKDALVPMQTAFRIDPKPAFWFFACSGNVYYHIGMYEKAVTDLKKGLELAPNSIWLHRCLAVSYSALGKEKEAREEIAELLRVNPKLTLALFSKSLPYKNQSDLEQFLNDMRKAGLPE